MNEILQLLHQFGYITLFFSLMLELIIVPIPNEALMSYVGVLSFKGEMNIYVSILSAGFGGIIGATFSYWFGYKLGVPFFKKYGHYIHMGPEKMDKMTIWYTKYGKVLLIFSYFIPGIRHIASIITGVIKLPYRSFAIFSYIGVFLWVSAFISLGDILGPKWDLYHTEITRYLVVASLFFAMIALFMILIRVNRSFINESLYLLAEAFFKRFKSNWKSKTMIFILFALFVTLFSLMVGMTQDFICNEFDHFDDISHDLVFNLFTTYWKKVMIAIFFFSSWETLSVICALNIFCIFLFRKNSWLEFIFFFFTEIGVFFFSKGINWLFYYLFSNQSIGLGFPNEQTMLMTSIFGFFVFVLIRHHKAYFLSFSLVILFFIFLFSYFVSCIYLHHLQASDVAAGYVFSGAWLFGMILSLELFRFLSVLKKEKS